MPPRLALKASASKRLFLPSVAHFEFHTQSLTERQIAASRQQQLLCGQRSFSNTSILSKGKKGKSSEVDKKSATGTSGSGNSEVDKNLTQLSESIQEVHSKLATKLEQLKSGSRFNVNTLENLKVQLKKDDKKSYRLADLAQIIPKGRQLMIAAGEKDHVKAIISAIQNSEILQAQPQISADSPQEMTVAIPPPTKDSRLLAAQAVIKESQMAKADIEKARAVMNKKIRALKIDGTLTSDESVKALKDMENQCKNALNVSKGMIDSVQKELSS